MKSKDITTNEGRFDDIRSDQEEHVRMFFKDSFEANLDTLLKRAYEEAYDIGGQFRGPGLAQEIKKIALNSIDERFRKG